MPTLIDVLASAAVPATGWTLHTAYLHRRLAAARRDPLTGALRRDEFTRRARRLLHHHDNVLIGLTDLDHFKALNDDYGHAAGDQALAETVARLTDWAGPRGLVARLGGDEFAIATPLPPRGRDIRLARLARRLTQPIRVDGRLVPVTASIGAATPDTLGTRDLSTLLRAADAAMYAGKHTGWPVLASREHASTPSINGRRAGRPGTAHQAVTA